MFFSYSPHATGPHVVLLHGWAGSHRQWDGSFIPGSPNLVEELNRDFAVIAPDWRGHGQSPWSTDIQSFGRNLLSDLLHVLEQTSNPQVHLVAYSMGAIPALAFASRHPDRVASLILGDSLGHTDQIPNSRPAFRAEFLSSGGSMGALLAAEGSLPEEAVPMVDAMFAGLPNRESLIAWAQGCRELEVPLGEWPTCPVHGIGAEFGETDEAGQLPFTSFLRVPGSTHNDLFMRPEFVERVREILLTGGKG